MVSVQKPENPLLFKDGESAAPSFDASILQIPFAHRGRVPTKREFRKAFRGESARSALGELYSGCSIFGLTKGQFSLIDLVTAITEQTGPVSAFFSTWTAANADVSDVFAMVESGVLLDCRFMVDYTFQRRQPELAHRLRELFGGDSVRVTSNHAKFVLLMNDEWSVVVKTSMNLNMNPRIEDFDVADDPALAGYLLDLLNEVWAYQNAAAGCWETFSVANRRFIEL